MWSFVVWGVFETARRVENCHVRYAKKRPSFLEAHSSKPLRGTTKMLMTKTIACGISYKKAPNHFVAQPVKTQLRAFERADIGFPRRISTAVTVPFLRLTSTAASRNLTALFNVLTHSPWRLLAVRPRQTCEFYLQPCEWRPARGR